MDPEHRMVRRDAPDVGFGRRRAHAAEEDTDLGLPALQVRTQDGRLVLVVDLDRPERLDSFADSELAFSRDAQVAHPLRLTRGATR